MKNGRPVTTYTDLAEIRARLAVLRAKADRIARYHASLAAGVPDLTVLDEKQLAALARRGCVGFKYPFFGSLRRTIDRMVQLEHRVAA